MRAIQVQVGEVPRPIKKQIIITICKIFYSTTFRTFWGRLLVLLKIRYGSGTNFVCLCEIPFPVKLNWHVCETSGSEASSLACCVSRGYTFGKR